MNKLLIYPLLAAGIISFSQGSFAQKQPDKSMPIIQLTNVKTDNNMRLKITKDQVMADPNIRCKLAGCEVKDFTISFAPSGEGIHGPYKTAGSKIKEEQLAFLRESHNPEIKIFIEDVHLKNNGKDITTKPLILICVP